MTAEEPMVGIRAAALNPYCGVAEAFAAGADTPRDFLERCLALLEARGSRLRAFTALSIGRARLAADAATIRWRSGAPLSPIDGIPLAIKDVIDVDGLPTGMGSPAADGYRPLCDAASVFALREAGAAIVGKTTTTEFASGYPIDTRNPHDLERTSGGSSAGSAAAVGAGILPLAMGTQVVGSILRPASFCGAFGYKPTVGALNRGGSHERNLSHSNIGFIGADLTDMWHATYAVASRVGGDPGGRGFVGPAALPEARCPARLAVMETAGWEAAGAVARSQLEALVADCESRGVTVITRHDDLALAALEDHLADALQLARDIVAFETVWPLKAIAHRDPDGVSPAVHECIAAAERLGVRGYYALLDRRTALCAEFSEVASRVDGWMSLSAPGAAPVGFGSTGDARFTVVAAVLGAPSLTLPVFEDGGMPLGLQVLAAPHEDAMLFALARWLLEA